jgi:hypothetical protein
MACYDHAASGQRRHPAELALGAAPAKHSTRQIEEVLERIEVLYRLGVDRHLIDVPDVILRRYARRLASRPPAVGARIAEPARTIEVACFLRYCLLATTDHLLFMVRSACAAQCARQTTLAVDCGPSGARNDECVA